MCSNERPDGGYGADAEDGSRLPVIDPTDLGSTPEDRDDGERDGGRDREGLIVGVVLAAGTSSRFERANKLLAEVDEEPIVRRAATTLCGSAVDRVVVVVGHEQGRVREALCGLNVVCVENAKYERGQSASVEAGVRAAEERGAEAVVIALGDMPAVETTTIDALTGAYRAGAGDALAAAYEGQRGNPVLFDRRYFDDLRAISGDRGGREILLEGTRSALVECGDPGVLGDVDTRADLDDRR